ELRAADGREHITAERGGVHEGTLAVAYCCLHAAGPQINDCIGGVEPEVDRRKIAAQPLETRHEPVSEECCRRGQRDAGSTAFAQPRHYLSNLDEARMRCFKELRTVRRQSDGSGRSIQNAPTEKALELPNVVADGGGSDRKLFSGPLEACPPRDGFERPQCRQRRQVFLVHDELYSPLCLEQCHLHDKYRSYDAYDS